MPNPFTPSQVQVRGAQQSKLPTTGGEPAGGGGKPAGGGGKPAGGGGKGGQGGVQTQPHLSPGQPQGKPAGGGKGGQSGQGGSLYQQGGQGGQGPPGGGGAQTTPWWEMTGGAWGESGMPAWTAPSEGITGDAARSIVRSNPVLDQAANQLSAISGAGQGAQDLAVDQIFKGSGAHAQYGRTSNILDDVFNPNWHDKAMSDNLFDTRKIAALQVNPEDIRNDAAVKESVRQFQEAELPLIENMSALSGLGRSTAVKNAAASRQAATMLPLLQEATGRAERRQNRILDSAFQRAAGHGQKGQDIASRRLAAAGEGRALGGQMTSDAMQRADRLLGISQKERGQDERMFDKLFQLGDYSRGLEQNQQDAYRDDWLRLGSMFENSINGPAGLIPGLFGGTTSGGKK